MLQLSRKRDWSNVVLASILLAACATDGQMVAPKSPSSNGLTTIWHNAGSSRGSSHVAGNTAYFKSETHEIFAFEKTTGTLKWKKQLPVTDQWYAGENIRMVGNTLVVGDIHLFGLDSADGSIKWKAQPSQGFNPGLFGFTTDGVNVYTGSSSGHMYSFNGTTGQQNWSTALVSNLAASIYNVDLVDSTLYAGFTIFYMDPPPYRPDSGAVAAVDARSGAIKWLTHLPRTTTKLPTKVVGSAVAGPYVITSSREGYVYALNRSNGTIAWTAPPLVANDYDARPIAASGDKVFLGSSLGVVTAYRVSDGQKVWQTNLARGSINYHISADDKYVYAINGGGDLDILSIADGKHIIRQRAPGYLQIFEYEPVSVDNVLYIGGSQGYFAFKRP